MHARAAAIGLTLVLTLALAACGASSTPTGGTGAGAASGGALTLGAAWARATAAGGTSAAYLTITNGTATDDTLVGVSAASVTSDASLHETTTDSSGMTGMQHTAEIKVPAGQTVMLQPGGYHIMLMDLTKDLTAGDKLDLVLTFEQAGPVTVTADVRAG
jgi:periplasmic copper chaperone A